MSKARLIFDPPSNGAWNMSVDQALLETADSTGLITLRFYTWEEPTLSLGYFQNFKDRSLHPPSADVPLVRRKTGGGAILHDKELTYSLCVPSRNRWSTRNTDLYQLVHKAIIEIFAGVEIESALYSDSEPPSDSPAIDQNAFMCFQRRSDGDIVSHGHKIVGSAQRRNKNSLLQHGSILLNASTNAPDLLGVNDLSKVSVLGHELSQKLAKGVFKALDSEYFVGNIENDENRVVKQIYSFQFNNASWNQRR